MIKGKKIFRPLSSKEICHVYELLVSQGFVSFNLTPNSLDKLESIVASITQSYFGTEIYSSIEEKLVAYLFLLIKDHPFVDGNKRTASLVFETLCEINEIKPSYKDATLDVWAVFIEKVQDDDHHKVIKILAKMLFPTPLDTGN